MDNVMIQKYSGAPLSRVVLWLTVLIDLVSGGPVWFLVLTAKMQGGMRSFLSHGNVIRNAVLQRVRMVNPLLQTIASSRFESVTPARIEEHGFESTTISDILNDKGKGADGSWLWCTTDDTVYDAVKSMTQNNVGALVVVKSDANKAIAGIITERDYLRKIIVQGRSSKSTKVGDIMTEENKLITVTPDTKVLQAMQLMTDNRIRHIPVIDEKGMIGMVSIGDVVRAVVREHRQEVERLNAFIQGGNYATVENATFRNIITKMSDADACVIAAKFYRGS
ncbi:CBS domain-containing protein CBSX3, mitochondrial [Glycine max]|nr:CBS domain-containing protein CBSX3, mitochondrial [Glycine max]